MSKTDRFFTPSQQNVIDYRGKNMLVSASAGTGKTTVMIERIVSLIREGIDVSEIVVVTFTNLAAAEMKARLATKLSQQHNDPRVIEQLEKLDTASICTLHSFCSELLRNYFYVVDIDPTFTILDSVTVATLRKNAMDDVFAEYFGNNDVVFRQVYKIFATHRREENFKNTILGLYDFSRCLENFSDWYKKQRVNFVELSDANPIITALLSDVSQTVAYFERSIRQLARLSEDECLGYTELLNYNAELLRNIRLDNLQNALFDLAKVSLEALPRKSKKVVYTAEDDNIRSNFTGIKKDFDKFADKYQRLCRGETIDTLWTETQQTTLYTDKLVEIVEKFDEAFYQAKKQRGGVDFNDLEYLTLKLLNNQETLDEIVSRYKLVFVDEYQDTNPVQEAIISRLAERCNLFMVGDVKQSIYGFRGCDPSIFVDKYDTFNATGTGKVVELNDNFRSNRDILNFVNVFFNALMTTEFGKVDYRRTAQLHGETPPVLKTASVRVNLIGVEEGSTSVAEGLYDITAETQQTDDATQGQLIARRIKQYVGKVYYDKKDVKTPEKRIGYGDIVILTRNMTAKTIDIYNTLVAENIPVTASFKMDGFASSEVRTLINLLRVIDNPYNDIYMVGVCLSPLGGFTENELGTIRLDADGRDVPFYERLVGYAQSGKDSEIVQKLNALLEFLREIRFYARSASVGEVALRVLQQKDYHLYVEGLPNGSLRLRKLYTFIDSVRGVSYAQSVDKFLAFIDETDDNRLEEGLSSTNAVRIMTMHASKGLEFPVVIVAGLETKFRLNDTPSIQSNTNLGLAMRYYNFDTMRVADTLGVVACDLLNKIKGREEEMRLLYVAMTRAKYCLELVATIPQKQLTAIPKLPTRALTHLDWLMHVINKQNGVFGDGVEVQVINDFDDKGDSTGDIDYLCQQTVSRDEVDTKLAFGYKYASQTNMPTKIVSSALDKEYIEGDGEPQPDRVLNVNNDRNFIGTAYHKVYQYVNYAADANEIQATIQQLVNDGKIEGKFANQLDVSLIYNTLRNPQLVQLLCGGKVYHEIPFMMYVPYDEVAKDKRFSDEVMLQGVIDLLIVGDKHAMVVDFKYTSHSDLVEQRYTAQLNSYRLAVKRICGIEQVDCYVLSIADNKLIKM